MNIVGQAITAMHMVEAKLQTAHEIYLRLGQAKEDRLKHYRSLFDAHVDVELLNEIRSCLNKGLALGNDRFTNEIELLTSRRIAPKKAGRPKKQ